MCDLVRYEYSCGCCCTDSFVILYFLPLLSICLNWRLCLHPLYQSVAASTPLQWLNQCYPASSNADFSLAIVVVLQSSMRLHFRVRPTASTVLSQHLRLCDLPPWTSYFVRYWDVVDDQRGRSHFNWCVDHVNYHILRTGCFPYIKYHCSRRPWQDLSLDNRVMGVIKVVNLGVPCLVYGLAAMCLIRHTQLVNTDAGSVPVFFLYKEDVGSQY